MYKVNFSHKHWEQILLKLVKSSRSALCSPPILGLLTKVLKNPLNSGYSSSISCRQCDGKGESVVFSKILIAWSGFNLHPGHVVASLDKMLYDDYLCWWLRTSSKFKREESNINWKTWKPSTSERARTIRPQDSVTVAFSCQKDNNAFTIKIWVGENIPSLTSDGRIDVSL